MVSSYFTYTVEPPKSERLISAYLSVTILCLSTINYVKKSV